MSLLIAQSVNRPMHLGAGKYGHHCVASLRAKIDIETGSRVGLDSLAVKPNHAIYECPLVRVPTVQTMV